ncbi:MAG: phosphoribulokinase [Gammaproteobacteria bacterium]|nr:phosphoribulokinase [Gammaproteobacteria bacterium]
MGKSHNKCYPVVAVTGSSGAGTTSVKEAFGHVFFRENIRAILIEGDSFHRYDRNAMRHAVRAARKAGRTLSHFGREANLFDELAELFRTYRETGGGRRRFYLHSDEEAQPWGLNAGQFTPWEEINEPSDLLMYEGLHGGVPEVAPYVDLLIGVVPTINLEWIQKIHRDCRERGYTPEEVVTTIKSRMDDYVDYITPQFSLTDINFQRIPTVDTSNPFIARDVPSADESLVVIRIKKRLIKKFDINLTFLKNMIEHSFISRRNTLVVPGPKMSLAMEILITPIIEHLVASKHSKKRYKR